MEEKNRKNFINKMAHVVRVVTIPPLMIATLLCMLYFAKGFSFASRIDMSVAFAGLVLLPVLAYPVWSVFGKNKKDKRNGQRQLAFIFSFVGYVSCFAYSLNFGTDTVREIFFTYFFTVVLLSLLNKVLHIRASGHAASAVSPGVFSIAYIGLTAAILFGVLFIGSVWASLYLKRHKWTDILAGICSMIISFILAKIIK